MMPAQVTEKWSEEMYSEAESRRVFEVTDVADGVEAANAVPANARFNATHPKNGLQRAGYPQAVQTGFKFWTVTTNYTLVPSGGEDPTEPGTVNSSPRIKWNRVVDRLPTDRAADGYIMQNTAGDTYDPRETLPIASRTVSITIWRTQFPTILADAFEDKINAGAIDVTNSKIVYPPEAVKCLALMPAEEFPADATVIPLVLTLEIRSGNNPFRVRRVNQGRNGWYMDGTTRRKAPITYKDTSTGTDKYLPVNEDVLLNHLGRPLDTTLTVGGKPPVDNPYRVDGWQLDTDTPNSPQGITPEVQMWRGALVADFQQLFIGLGIL